MSQTQSEPESDQESNQDSDIPESVRKEMKAIAASQAESVLDQADLATEEDLQSIKKDVAGEVDGLQSDLDGLRADLESLASRVLSQDEIEDLSKSYALGALDHLISETCSHDRHETIRDDLRAFVRDEMESVELERDADEDGETGQEEGREDHEEHSQTEGESEYSFDLYEAGESPWGSY